MRNNFIEEAIMYAEMSKLKVANHGAIVIFRGKIVGRGYNKYCVENVNKINRWSIHAEVDAINNALRKISRDDLRKSTLIVVRKLKDNTQIDKEITFSAPCKDCANFIIKNGLKRCYYS